MGKKAKFGRSLPTARQPETLDKGLALHRQGRLDKAEQIYRGILATTPGHSGALHLLGIVSLQTGRLNEADRLFAEALSMEPRAEIWSDRAIVLGKLQRHDEALSCIEQAVQLEPEQGENWFNLGCCLVKATRFGKALDSFDKALALQPHHVDAWVNRGNVLRDLGRSEEALTSFDRALQLRPRYPRALNNRGNALYDLARLPAALASYEVALAGMPDYVEALFNRGRVLAAMQRYESAAASYAKALALKPGYAEALTNQGLALQALNRFQEALDCFERALSLQDDSLNGLSNRGSALRSLGRFAEALDSFERALRLQPNCARTLCNRGVVFLDLHRPEDAAASFRQALTLQPRYMEAANNLGLALQKLGRIDEALVCYAQAQEWAPEAPHGYMNEAFCRLLTGDFTRGWAKYEWRWQGAQGDALRQDYPDQAWSGKETLHGKRILIYAEQGLGDTLQFCRYVPWVKQQGAHVTFAVQPSLKNLLGNLEGVDEMITGDDPLPPFDYFCPLLSLPLAHGTTLDNIPMPPKGLGGNADLEVRWAERIAPLAGLKIGIVGSGNPAHKDDHNRSVGLGRLADALSDSGHALICLQRELWERDHGIVGRCPSLTFFGEELRDFSDTAALIANLDLVISVDTSVAHLAGTLGKPTWILLPVQPDWRWLLGRASSPWYSTVRLFRQTSAGEWNDVLTEIETSLRDLTLRGS